MCLYNIVMQLVCMRVHVCRLLVEELGPGSVAGLREAVQLREQDWGNFQDPKVQVGGQAAGHIWY